ncbi:LLM class flavin-dependent oxidoreductase [Pseudonocardia cypriaca]|uniref:Alkanesulfonate monooxygenase SsuD/methylene tetrahydromethanopterin reductase-like flavin-dependent oxidoreductase (Luciferase family) n=1 Tax=Pseudonocardia cypriaca TaxID=882449 RepID=A0A543FNZ9_9PSEU|nr:LLM class flavin-dependent oxidoreductase [Pseudonocardia cypriaca]TQM35575.1 alkanesulfonate monooxygenase SsuD/methylene tetrahydromethanopterin reductase-like flavin-dependent oxidoreductase (luciferase family) [Pseudonocardia cypriaca]
MSEPVFGFGAHSTIDDGPELLRMVERADRDGLDLFSLSDHPYLGARLDAYASIGFLLGRTQRIAGFANVTNLPLRPAPVLARTVTSLSALSGGRVVLGMGAGGLWNRISDMGVPRLSPDDAVRAFEEAIVLVRRLAGGGPPVTFEGRYHRVEQIEPAPVAAPPVWTGSVGPKSLAATGRVADGWLPGHAADWLSERYRTSRPIIDDAAAAVGRDPREIRTIFNFPGRITEQPLPATRDRDGRWVGGSVDQWVEELTGAVLEHGASGFMLFSPSGGTPDATSAARWGGEIVPAVRESVAVTGAALRGAGSRP